jgi:PEP-CTERM motif
MRHLHLLAMLGVTVASQGASAAQIVFFPYLSPTSAEEGFPSASPSFPVAAATAVSAIFDNVDNRGGSLTNNPTAFNRLAQGVINPLDILAGTHPLWRGDVNPTGAFAAETGTWWHLGVRVISDQSFTLSDLTKDFNDGYGFSDTFTMAQELTKGRYAENGFAPTLAVGLWYGPDGRKGTADDVYCDSSACDVFTQQLNEFAWRGAGKGDWLDDDYVNANLGGDWSLAPQDELDFYANDGYGAFVSSPFFWHYDYSLKSGTTTLATGSFHQYVSAVPEPSTWLMALFGFGLLGAKMRHRRIRLQWRRILASRDGDRQFPLFSN